MIKISDEEEGAAGAAEVARPPTASMSADFEEELVYTLQPPPGPKPKEVLQPLDMTPFMRFVIY